jgi:hypothetical protein
LVKELAQGIILLNYMTSIIKNIIIFVVIGAALVLAYLFFFKQAPVQPGLTSSSPTSTPPSGSSGTAPSNSQDFLSVLLNVKSIKLSDDIFSDPAFTSLHNTSIDLSPDGTEGRPNPFAQIGSDNTAIPTSTLNTNIKVPSVQGPQTPANIIPKATQ